MPFSESVNAKKIKKSWNEACKESNVITEYLSSKSNQKGK